LRHVIERLAVPLVEGEELGAALARDHGLALAELEASLVGRLARHAPPGREGDPAGTLVVAVENLPRLQTALGQADGSAEDSDAAALDVLAEWLRFYGPVDPDFPARALGIGPGRARPLVAALIRGGALVAGRLVSGGGPEDVCDTANFERLLRLGRSLAAPGVEAAPLSALVPFVAAWQGVVPPGRDAEDLFGASGGSRLSAHPADCGGRIFSRAHGALDPSMLDTVMRHPGSPGGAGGTAHLFHFPGTSILWRTEESPTIPGAHRPSCRVFPDPRPSTIFHAGWPVRARPGELPGPGPG
jgi:hypothetical protein